MMTVVGMAGTYSKALAFRRGSWRILIGWGLD